MPHPLVSVVMPCHNAAPYLEEAVASVFAQTLDDLELILVDDGSSDGSLEIQDRLAAAHPGRITLIRQRNQGPYPARNRGLAQAKGEFVAFLDADDWWREDFLERCHQALRRHPEAVLAYCGWQNVGLPGRSGQPYIPPDYDAEDKLTAFLRAAAPWPIHAALVHRQDMIVTGGFHLDLFSCMDYDLWLRLGATRPIVRVAEVMAFYRHHDHGQITSKQGIQAENSWRVKKKFLAAHPEIAAALGSARVRELVDGGLLRRGYDAYWKRDLVSARHIFQRVLRTRAWGPGDLKYLLPALLPASLYERLIKGRDN